MNNINAQDWRAVAHTLSQFIINNDEEAIEAGDMLYALRHQIKSGHTELKVVYQFISFQIDAYEATLEQPKPNGLEMLKYLMEEHEHKQKDLVDVAPKSVISAVMNGNRKLNLGQIKRLAEKYSVSPEVFM